MKKNNIIAAVTAGLMMASTATAMIQSSLEVETVYAASTAEKKVQEQLTAISKGIKIGGLTTKNIEVIKKLIGVAKSLNSKISSTSIKNKNAAIIGKVEGLIQGAEGVNSLEASYNKNAKTMENALIWEASIEGIRGKLAKIDKSIFKSEVDALNSRVAKVVSGISTIRADYKAGLTKVEAGVKEAEALVTSDKQAALAKAVEVKKAAVALQRDTGKLPLIVRLNTIIKGVDPSLIKETKVTSGGELSKLRGYYDVITFNMQGDFTLTNVDVGELNVSTGNLETKGCNIGVLNSNGVDGIGAPSEIGIETSKVGTINIYGLTTIDQGEGAIKPLNSKYSVDKINVNLKEVQVKMLTTTLNVVANEVNIDKSTYIELYGNYNDVNIVGSNNIVFINNVVNNLRVNKGVKETILCGTDSAKSGQINKLDIVEPGTIITDLRHPENSNVEKNGDIIIVKVNLALLEGILIPADVEDVALFIEDNAIAIGDLDTTVKVVAVSGKKDTYAVTITSGKYSETKEIKAILQ
ncbi:MAG: hypothetical protein RR838_04070 [Clostridium sp.]